MEGKGPLEGKYDLGFHFSAEWEDERCEAEKQEPVCNTPNTTGAGNITSHGFGEIALLICVLLPAVGE